MTFVEDEILDLDKPLFQYLPYPDIEYDERYKKITARMVLSHRSGFPNWRYDYPDKKVLAHLHHWHLLLLDWYKKGMSGEKPDMPSKGYTWKTLFGLNKKIWTEYQNMELETVKEFLDISFANVQKIINIHTSEEIYEMNKYKWTGTTSLGGYLISNTSSHYDWAIKLIKKSL